MCRDRFCLLSCASDTESEQPLPPSEFLATFLIDQVSYDFPKLYWSYHFIIFQVEEHKVKGGWVDDAVSSLCILWIYDVLLWWVSDEELQSSFFSPDKDFR